MSILMADDTPDNLILLQAHLRKEGYTDLIAVPSAQKIFEQLDTRSDIDLILLDFMMPEINGVEACRRIKEDLSLKDLPIIMITARTDLETLDDAFKAGAMDYILKPVRKVELIARVRSALSLKKAMDERKARERELEAQNQKLEKAMKEIKTLQGFIPICAHCKKIRKLEGQWQQMEAYFQEHSDVKFSHGICETCMQTQYQHYRAQA